MEMNMRLVWLVLVGGCSDVLADPPVEDGGATDVDVTATTGSGTDDATASYGDGSSSSSDGSSSGGSSSGSDSSSGDDATSTGAHECDPEAVAPVICFRDLSPGTMVGSDNPTAFIANDLDADGAVDLTTADAEGRSVSSFRGTGDGWFWPGTSSSVDPTMTGGTIYMPVGGVQADIDGDGHDELLVGLLQLFETDLLVFDSDGTDAFTLASSMILPGHVYEFHGVPLDIDGDLDVDIVTNAGADGIGLVRNDGGTLTIETVTTAAAPTNVRAFDMVGDDAIDVVVTHADGLELLENVDGVLTSIAGVPGPNIQGGLALGDLDGDGIGDAVAIDAFAAEISVFLGADGSFAEPMTMPSLFEPYEFSAPRSELELADLEGDGDLDLVVGGTNDGIAVFTGDGEGGFDEGVLYDVGRALPRIELADFDGDGRTDIAGLNALGHLRVLLADPCACE
jgi:hypothetical protein